MAKERLAYFDNIKGVLIALVVAGHLLEPTAKLGEVALEGFQVLDFIYLFHMPLFIFVTGLFSKSVYRNGLYRAEVPLFYFLMCMLLYTGLMVEKYCIGTGGAINYLTLSGRIPWYLMVVGFYVLAVPFFARLKPATAMGGGLAIALLAPLVEGTNMLSASRAITFLPVFLAGYYMQPSSIVANMREILASRKALAVGCSLAAMVIAIVFFQLCGESKLKFFLYLFYGKMSYAEILSKAGLHLPLIVCVFARLVAYVAVTVMGVALFTLVPINRVPLLTTLGSRSLQVYVLHPFIYYALNSIKFTKQVFECMPSLAAVALLIALGVAIAILLSLSGKPQELFDKMKAGIARWVERQSS